MWKSLPSGFTNLGMADVSIWPQHKTKNNPTASCCGWSFVGIFRCFCLTQIRDHFQGWMFPNSHCTCLRREQDALAKLKVFGVLLSCGFVCKRGLSLFEGYVWLFIWNSLGMIVGPNISHTIDGFLHLGNVASTGPSNAGWILFCNFQCCSDMLIQ